VVCMNPQKLVAAFHEGTCQDLQAAHLLQAELVPKNVFTGWPRFGEGSRNCIRKLTDTCGHDCKFSKANYRMMKESPKCRVAVCGCNLQQNVLPRSVNGILVDCTELNCNEFMKKVLNTYGHTLQGAKPITKK